MPMKTYTEKYWRCSWSCGFKRKDPKKVIEHENKVHRARQKARRERLFTQKSYLSCQLCKTLVKDIESLKQHLKNNHPIKEMLTFINKDLEADLHVTEKELHLWLHDKLMKKLDKPEKPL